MFIAISSHKSLVKVISESKFEGSTEFYLSSLRNYSFLFHSVALMSKKKGLSARRRNSGTDILNVIVMQIYRSGEVKLLFIVLQFKTISSFTTRKELRATGKWQFSTDFCQNIQPCCRKQTTTGEEIRIMRCIFQSFSWKLVLMKQPVIASSIKRVVFLQSDSNWQISYKQCVPSWHHSAVWR